MIELRLSTDEALIMRRILRSYLSDLRMEIADTDSYDFRSRLKEEKLLLEAVLEQLAPAENKSPPIH
jgi:hypothetical protein